MDSLQLAAGFEPPTHDDWLAAVDKVLRGKDFDRTLVRRTADGFDIQPLYGPGEVPARGTVAPPHRPHGRWDIRSAVPTTAADANTMVLNELENGATSLELIGGAGALAALLDGVLLDLAPISLRAGADVFARVDELRRLVEAASEPVAGGSLGFDPLGTLAERGWWDPSLDATWDRVAELAAADAFGPYRLVTASGTAVNGAGASEATEIAWIVASAVDALRALDDRGLDPADAAARIELDATADVDVFLTVAKLRALRRCWATVLGASDAGDAMTSITVRSGQLPLTVVDPWVNLLRGTAATFGAVVGGADTVVISPFDGVANQAGDLGRRLARNTQLLLQDESMIGFVNDPAGGSWFIEDLTERLSERAWELFQQIEAAGGATEYLRSGKLAAAIAPAADRRRERVARRTRPITGVSEFPLLDERRPAVGDPHPAASRPADVAETVDALPRERLAEPFEALRSAAEAAAARPTVWIEAIGPLANHTPRVGFTTNALAAGGIAVAGNSESSATFADSGCSVVIVCGADGDYAEGAETVVADLKSAGAEHVYLAGAPGDLEHRLGAVGIEGFLVLGDDLVAFLTRLHDQLGVAA